MTQTDLEPDEAVRMAAEWLASDRAAGGGAVVPELKNRFGISALQSCEAIRQAQALRRARAL